MALPRRARLAISIPSENALDSYLPSLASMADVIADAVFLIATALAILVVAFDIINYLSDLSKGYPVFSIVSLMLAGIILLIGFLFRKVVNVFLSNA